MDEEGLAEAWGSAVADALDYNPPSADYPPFSLDDLVASGAEVPENFTAAYRSYLEDFPENATVETSDPSSFSKKQWAILAVTHLPLILLWMYALLGAFERASIAARWVSKALGTSHASGDDFDEDAGDGESETRRLMGGDYQHPGHPHVRVPPRALPEHLPYVCVQLPMYNDPAVARRIIDAACLLRWPRDLLEIQILDDSDDERCVAIVDATATTWRERGLMCNVVRRSHRRGFKAGALEAGRKKTAADLITVFDSDCVPPPDYLERVVPHFYHPDGSMVADLAMVQARWGFLNYDDGFLTMAQAMRLEAHRAAGSAVLSRAVGCVVAAGAGATWSARAVTAAGGWDSTALLESVDLALRAYCAGYESRFLPHTVVMTELPGTFAAYKCQQERWAQGWAQMMKRHALDLLDLHGRPMWCRWYLFSAVVRESMWPVALAWMLTLPVLIWKGAGWWLGGMGVFPRPLALLVYAAPPALLVAADALSAAALPPAPPLLMKHGQAAAVRLSWLIPYLAVQTGMVVVHAASFILGVVNPRVEFARTPKDGRGGYYTEAALTVARPRAENANTSAVTQSPSKRVGQGGHPFEVQNIARSGGLAPIPGTPPPPPRPERGKAPDGEVVVDVGTGSSSSNDPASRITQVAAGVAAKTPENAARRWTIFTMETVVFLAMVRLSFAVASKDGWNEPAVVCDVVAACVLYVALNNWDDAWSRRGGRKSPARSPTASPGGESLLGGSRSGTYGGLDGPAGPGSRASGGVYDRARKPPNPPAAPSAVQSVAIDASRDPQTRAAIRQYKRYRAKDFDLDNISIRSADSDAHSAGVSAFGGKGGRGLGSAFGSDWGESDAGQSETVYSELSAAVFADAPPVLLTAAQLQQHYVGGREPARAGSNAAPGSEAEGAVEEKEEEREE